MKFPKSSALSVNKAAALFKQKKIGIIPTDTVYGFSGIVDLDVEKKIFSIKGRAEEKPFIQLIARPKDIFKYTDAIIPENIFNLWPCALTIIVQNNDFYKKITRRNTTAFRCPGDDWLRALILEVGEPLFSTSVNRSAKPILQEIKEIKREFEQEVDFIVEDGDKKGALSSTIVECLGNTIKILRQGSVIIS